MYMMYKAFYRLAKATEAASKGALDAVVGLQRRAGGRGRERCGGQEAKHWVIVTSRGAQTRQVRDFA